MKQAPPVSPLDLHVLGTPPAFVLSQDQTLMFESLSSAPRFPKLLRSRNSPLWLPRQRQPPFRFALAPPGFGFEQLLTLRNLTSLFFSSLYRFQGSPPAFGPGLPPAPQAASAIITPDLPSCQHFSMLIVCESRMRTQFPDPSRIVPTNSGNATYIRRIVRLSPPFDRARRASLRRAQAERLRSIRFWRRAAPRR